jgi:hypothetical protein
MPKERGATWEGTSVIATTESCGITRSVRLRKWRLNSGADQYRQKVALYHAFNLPGKPL